jgi:hypothetical protein
MMSRLAAVAARLEGRTLSPNRELSAIKLLDDCPRILHTKGAAEHVEHALVGGVRCGVETMALGEPVARNVVRLRLKQRLLDGRADDGYGILHRHGLDSEEAQAVVAFTSKEAPPTRIAAGDPLQGAVTIQETGTSLC